MNRSMTLVVEVLKKMEISYQLDEAGDTLSFPANVQETTVRVMAITEGGLLSLRAFLPFTVPARRRKDAIEFVVRASYWIRNGSFNLDMATGRMAFSVASPVRDETITQEDMGALMAQQMDHIIHHLTLALVPLLKLAHGVVRAKQALAQYDESRREPNAAPRIPNELVSDDAIAVN